MRKSMLAIFTCLFLTLNAQNHSDFSCLLANEPISFPPGPNSTYGYEFTPKDTMRLLVIYAGFSNVSESGNVINYDLLNNNDDWPRFQPGTTPALPEFSKDDQLFYDNYIDIEENFNWNKLPNLSNLYWEMSAHADKPFKVIAEHFPERVDVFADSSTIHTNSSQGIFNTFNERVFDTIQARINRNESLYLNFNWNKFDNRQNLPLESFDNSLTSNDGYIDYVIIIWRYERYKDPLPLPDSTLSLIHI